MTVAAVILSATEEGALADTLGQPRVRRLVDIAWSGGALPIVVLSPDPTGRVATTLIGTDASHGTPAPPEAGSVGQMVRGIELARAEVGETTGALLWPARMTWVGPETITSLIETHGTDPATVLRPGWHGEPGWPVLVPTADLDVLRRVPAELMPPAVVETLVSGVASRLVEVGDPGVVYPVDTPLDELPSYEGPPEPSASGVREWGADVAAEAGLPEPGPSPTR